MQHPDYQLIKEKTVLLLTRKTCLPRKLWSYSGSARIHLNMPLLENLQSMYHCDQGWVPIVHVVARTPRNHVHKEGQSFSPKKSPKGTKKNDSLGDGSVATVADAFPQLNVQGPTEESAPQGGMSTDNCDNAFSIPQSKHVPNQPKKKIHLPSPVSLSRGPGSAKPCTHEGRVQHIAPASGQDAMCCETQRNEK